jgi:hypothetical protein
MVTGSRGKAFTGHRTIAHKRSSGGESFELDVGSIGSVAVLDGGA